MRVSTEMQGNSPVWPLQAGLLLLLLVLGSYWAKRGLAEQKYATNAISGETTVVVGSQLGVGK